MTWLADVALDGIVGGAIGAGVTGLTVWRTLATQRRLNALDAQRQRYLAAEESHRHRLEADTEAALVAVLRVTAACARLSIETGPKHVWPPTVRRALADIVSATSEARARLFFRWRATADAIADASIELAGIATSTPERDVVSKTRSQLEEITRICRRWIEGLE